VAAPSEIERVIVQHGRTEAAKQAKLVAKQVKEAGTNRTAEKGPDLERGLKVGLDSVGTDVGARGISSVDNKVAVTSGSGGQSIMGAAPPSLPGTVSTVDSKVGKIAHPDSSITYTKPK
jgi:hypothetical protein